MDKRKYFTDLISLYEAVGMTGAEEVVPQEEIADSGEDVGPENPNEAPVENDNENLDNNLYMNQEDQPQEVDPSLVLKKEKFKKLFELFEDLLNYGTIFSENVKFIDISLLDSDTYKKMRKYSDDIDELVKKINNYLINIFNSETYEKVLYSYILFRTELLTAIKGLRTVLKLNKPDEPLKLPSEK